MPRKRRVTDAQIAEIRSLRHLGQRDIAKRVGVSLGTVNAALATDGADPLPATAPATKGKRGTPAKAKPPADVPPPDNAPAEDDVDGLPVVARLTRSLAALEKAADLASADRDVARMVSVQRAIANVTALAARLAPPPAVDPNANPDMVKAAKGFREKVFEQLDRIIAEHGKATP